MSKISLLMLALAAVISVLQFTLYQRDLDRLHLLVIALWVLIAGIHLAVDAGWIRT